MKAFDYPPMWLVAALAVAWMLGDPAGAGPVQRALGACLVLPGLALMAAAAFSLLQARTTVIPRQAPRALVTEGIFRYTRNPIYLGDALLLAGLILRWDALIALPLVPLFVWLIDRRFIAQEEATLRDAFGAEFDAYAARTRRWI